MSGFSDSTWATCLTPAGAAAIATLALRGPNAWEVVRKLYRPLPGGKELPPFPKPGRFRLGYLGTDVVDQVVLAVKEAAPCPWVEVHCHGGPEVVRLLLETLGGQGVEVIPWPNWWRATSPDPFQAEAAAALAEAPTFRTAKILLDQFQGALRARLANALAALHNNDWKQAEQVLENVARHGALGRHLTTPWKVVLAGAPNVGKSSLLNALAGFQRSVVTAAPGTTRDVVTALLAFDGWPVEITDTAGIRESPDGLEGQGIERARAAVTGSDLCLWVLDASTAPVWPEVSFPGVKRVVNKVDLPPAWDLQLLPDLPRVSALTGQGLPELGQLLGEWLVPSPPPPGAPVPFTLLLCQKIQEARELCWSGKHSDVIPLLEALGL